MAGPDSSTIRAVPILVGDLARSTQRFDVLYLMPGPSTNSIVVVGYVRQHRVVSISSDPACLTVQCCVLMVRAGSSTEIVLDTELAAATGARFSSVFTMMVKRK